MLALFTDFGLDDAYVGQMHAACLRENADVRIVDLLHHAPRFDPRASAYLLPALAGAFPPKTVFVCVVDPGVGSSRPTIVVHADERWFVGPDNGLLSLVVRRAERARSWRIGWAPPRLSRTFHGRDLFAPVAARLHAGDRSVLGEPCQALATQWPDDWPRVIYVDHFGNAVTGMRLAAVPAQSRLRCRDRVFEHAATFSDVAVGAGLWLVNSSGLVELAANQASAAERFGIRPGDEVTLD